MFYSVGTLSFSISTGNTQRHRRQLQLIPHSVGYIRMITNNNNNNVDNLNTDSSDFQLRQHSPKRRLTDISTSVTTPVPITKKVIISKIIDTLWTKRVSEPTVEEIVIDPLSLYNTTKPKSNSSTNLAPDFVYFEFTIIASNPSRHRNKIKLLSLSLF